MRRKSKQVSFWDFYGFKIDAGMDAKLAAANQEVVAILKDIDETVPKLKSSTALKDIFESCERTFNEQEHIKIKRNKEHNYWKCNIKFALEEQDTTLLLATGQDRHKKKAVALAYKGACSALSKDEKWREFFVATMLGELHISHHPQNMIALICPLHKTNKEFFDINLICLISQFLLEEEITIDFSKIQISDRVIEILQKDITTKHRYSFVGQAQAVTISAGNFR